MRILGVALVAFAVFFLASCGGDGKKQDKTGPDGGVKSNGSSGGKKEKTKAELIVGVWEIAKGEMPLGSTIEFTNTGKQIVTIMKGKEVADKMEGTYKVEDDTLKTTFKGLGTDTDVTLGIKKLDDTTLILGATSTDEFKRKH